MKRLSWSKLFNLAALASLGLVAFGPANAATGIADRAPNTPISARIPGVYPSGSNPQAAPNTRAIFEGPNATDYFNFAQTDSSLANPEVAVGPEDILMVVNRQIFRVPNGNAPGVAPTVLNPLFTGSTVSQKSFLDNWIGETALNQLCPTGSAGTGVTRTSATCQIDNASVKYDQMHGRFLVLFTVVDTGLTPDNSGQNFLLTRPRKASWVLIVSRTAVLVDTALFDAAGNPLNPNAAGTKVFETPTPGGLAVTGGIGAQWAIYYGNDVAALGSDGFGSNQAFAGVGVGNINSLPGIGGSTVSFDCSPGAVSAANVVPTGGVCYLPTAARLGIDNDTITIVSPVVNANINSANLSPFNNPVAGPGLMIPGYAGNRVRVIKKTAIYNFKIPLGAGNQFAGGGFAARAAGDYYDLYSNDGAGNPVTNPGGSPIPYTAVSTATPSATSTSVLPGDQPALALQSPGSLAPLFYEPVHLRGRAMATFSNQPMLNGGTRQQSQTYLVGTISTNAVFMNTVFIQGIIEIQNPVVTIQRGVMPFYPVLQNGIAGFPAQNGFPTGVAVDFFSNPGTAPQQNFRGGGAAPNLFVGDDRPLKVIFREGHLYDARTGFAAAASNQFGNNPTATLLSTTVFYDIIQKLHHLFSPLDIFQAKWQNTNAWAPMFDVPANVSLAGQISPINQLPYLEKLFVATTYPPLVSQDPLFASTPGGDPRSREDSGSSGVPVLQLIPQANCFNNQQVPGASVTGINGGTSFVANNALAWPGLFDIRCGMDPADANPSLRNPGSGIFQAQVAYTIRGSAATDPNDGSLWNFGAYSRKRNASIGTLAHWGTFAANYKLSFPTQDPYGNSYAAFSDIADANGNPLLPEYPYIQMAAINGLSPTRSSLTPPNATLLPFNGVNATLYPTPPAVGNAPGAAPAAGTFGPNDAVTRREMAAWIVKSQMDEGAITDYLAATSTLNGSGAGGNATSFADVPTTDPGYRYIEVMARRGYTSGCSANVALRYCPDYIATRKDLAVFMIRAKFSNIFNTVLSGCSFGFVGGTTTPAPSTLFPPAMTTSCSATGDNFGLFTTGLSYFTDNPSVTGNDEYVFIQKMRELRITNGTFLGPNNDGRNGLYSRGAIGLPALGDPGALLRKQVATFMVRGFFL